MASCSNESLSRKYQKLEPRDHVLLRSGMYIGSTESESCDTWTFSDDQKSVTKRTVSYIPGLYKIFDEVLTNAIDHATRLAGDADSSLRVKDIRVTINRDNGEIEVFNSGQGIDVAVHPEHGVYIPELIFGNLLTSTNYDDTEERLVGGQNGLGAKCTNIFAARFKVETVDVTRKKHYSQEFFDNMCRKGRPVIRTAPKKPYTRITFVPDFARFNTDGISDDMYAILSKRVYDACALTPNEVTVYLNGQKLEYKTFERYADLYLGPKGQHARVYEKLNDRWEVIAALSPTDAFEHVSFVNGVWTIKGGRHIDCLSQHIAKRVCDTMQQRKKLEQLKPAHVKERLMIFVKAYIPNATFDSQSKETMTTPQSKFGCSRLEVSDAFVDKLCKSELGQALQDAASAAATKVLAKSDGKKRNILRGIAKLHDAGWAGSGARSKDAVLCLVEGDSASAMAIAGRSAAPLGTQKYGIFALKGKPLNARDATTQKLADNAEICAIKKILGLETGKTYTDTSQLRYGSVMLLCDADEDGRHIQGLVCNLFASQWPSLFKLPGFITVMRTPIVKCTKGAATHSHYSLSEFNTWKDAQASLRGWNIKYYKGLATSNSGEAKDYFRNIRRMTFEYTGPACDTALDLAFSKKRADDRKTWLEAFDPLNNVLDCAVSKAAFHEFVHNELIHFSTYDVERSIPNIMDGLKISQRKILYACLKRNLVREIRVAQLAGWVSECSLYHHGEASLQGAIVGMAQTYVGSNNINLLLPNGQFGTRLQGGKDAGSARYIHTALNPITTRIYRPVDDAILTWCDDDGTRVEPKHYLPVLPMLLVNGACGIGTGFSVQVPCYNPSDLRNNLQLLIGGTPVEQLPELHPWYRGFKGKIVKIDDHKWMSMGAWHRTSPTRIQIVELPLGVWTEDYKLFLEEWVDQTPDVKSFDPEYTDEEARFTIVFSSAAALEARLRPADTSDRMTQLEAELKLTSTKGLSTNNMYLFDENGRIRKYGSANEILHAFFMVRMTCYSARRESLLSTLGNEHIVLSTKARFVQAVIDKTLNIMDVPRSEVEAQLRAQEYATKDDGYDFLLGMPASSFTKERKQQLVDQCSELTTEIARIQAMTAADIWREDLSALP